MALLSATSRCGLKQNNKQEQNKNVQGHGEKPPRRPLTRSGNKSLWMTGDNHVAMCLCLSTALVSLMLTFQGPSKGLAVFWVPCVPPCHPTTATKD